MLMTIIAWLIVGGIAGWLAGLIVKGGGFGIGANIVIGILGAVIAGWVLPQIGVHIGGGFISDVVNAAIGAVILLIVISVLRRATS